MIWTKTFENLLELLPIDFLNENQVVLSKCFSVFLFVRIFPVETDMVVCLDDFAPRLLKIYWNFSQ